MKEGYTLKSGRSPELKQISLGIALGLFAMTLLGTGCDTVAQIAFPERSFSKVIPVSVLPVDRGGETGQCGGLVDIATMRVVFKSNDDSPIKPGEDVSLGIVDLTSDDISLSNGAIYSFPDQECQSGECPSSFTCTSNSDVGNRCINSTGLPLSGEPRFVGEDHAAQAQAIVMSQDRRWRGWLPTDLGGLNVFDQDGNQIQGPDTSPLDERATDKPLDRFGAVRRMLTDWETLFDNVSEDGRTAYVGLWSFADSTVEVESHISAVTSDASPWTRSAITARDAMDTEMRLNPGQVRSNVYRSLDTILRQGFVESSVVASTTSRSLVLIVPGHDERRETQFSVDDIITAANDLNVNISVVQVDAEMTLDTLRDDYRYYESQGPCTDNSECKNFEECRQPDFLGNNSIVHPADQEAQYCLPAYDQNGRIGPIHDYQRLACATGGSYSYIPWMTNELLYSRLEGLTMAPEGAWEIDFEVGEAQNLFPDQPFLLEGDLSVTLGRNTDSYNFAQNSSDIPGSGRVDRHDSDSRPVLFSPAE